MKLLALKSMKIVSVFVWMNAIVFLKSGHTYVKNGFLPESRITDFPIRDKRATLIVRRRRWKDEKTGEIVSNDYELVAKGTRHSKEFAAFLKGVLGSIPDSGFFA